MDFVSGPNRGPPPVFMVCCAPAPYHATETGNRKKRMLFLLNLGSRGFADQVLPNRHLSEEFI